MASETLTKLVTYDDYRHLPDDGKQYQIIEGELYMTPAPGTYHQEISINLSSILRDHVLKQKIGKVFSAPVDVVLSMTDVVQPDIVFVAKNRLNIITKKNIVEAPDFVVEILSEHTETIDRVRKKTLYEQHEVKEYWIVDPDAKTIEQYFLEEQKLVLQKTTGVDEKLTSRQLKDLSLSASDIF